MAYRLATLFLFAGFVGSVFAELKVAPQPQFSPQAVGLDCGTVAYVPAKLRTCKNGRCRWHDPEPSQAYMFTDPVTCFGAHCPPGTIGHGGKMRQ